MVQLLAEGVALCLLLDWRGDPDAVRAFVDKSWQHMEETQPPSRLQHALWLRRTIAEETLARHEEDETAAIVESGTSGAVSCGGRDANLAMALRRGTPLANAVSRITVREVMQRLRNVPPLSGQTKKEQRYCNGEANAGRKFSVGSSCEECGDGDVQCETVEALWVLTRLAVLVHRAVAVQMRQLLPPTLPSSSSSLSRDTQRDDKHDIDDSFRHESAVLVPVSLCRRISGLSLRQVVDLCCCAPNDGRSPSVTLIINPSVLPGNNPHRREKNRRLEMIQHTVMSQRYEAMVRLHSDRNSDTQPTGFSSQQQQQQQQQEAESFASFLSDASIGLDMQIMALSGGAVGYYMAHVRGFSTNVCIVCGAIGLITMLLVDAVLLMLRMGKVDAQTWKKKKKKSQRQWQRQERDAARQEQGDNSGTSCGDAVVLREKKNA